VAETSYKPRTSLLGGDTSRRSLFGRRTPAETLAISGGLLLGALIAVAGSSPAAWVLGFFVAAVPVGLVYLPGHGTERHLYQWLPVRWMFRRRKKNGQDVYRSGAAQAGVLVDTGSPVAVQPPEAVGKVRWLSFQRPGDGPLAILLHENRGDPYLTSVLEIAGSATGLRDDAVYDGDAERFGLLLAEIANGDSLIDGVQMLNRVLPIDPTEHARFVEESANPNAAPELHESYAELTVLTEQRAEQHRNYVVLRVPVDHEFLGRAQDYGKGDVGFTALMAEEVWQFAELCQGAGIQVLSGLGPVRLAALLRSLYDPDFPIDYQAGANPQSCWPQKTTDELDYLLVNDRWFHRVAHIPADAWPHEPVNMAWLQPLLTAVHPATLRVMTVLMDLHPAGEARDRAVRDLTYDVANAREQEKRGKISDGSELTQLSQAQQRIEDIREARAGGVTATAYVVVTARSEREVARASRRIANAARACGITGLDWLRCEHSRGFVNTLPLFRGLRRPKPVRGRMG
jgi:hypothetical protein